MKTVSELMSVRRPPDEPLFPHARTRLAVIAICLVAAAAVLAGVYIATPIQSREAATVGWVEHTHDVIRQIGQIVTDIDDAESGQRGFLLTSSNDYLAQHDAAVTRAGADLAALQAMTGDNPAQQRRIDVLRGQIGDKLAFTAKVIALARNGDAGGAVAVLRTGTGKAAMDAIRRTADEMSAEEQRLLASRRTDYDHNHRNANTLSAVLLGVGGLAVLAAGAAVSRAILEGAARRRVMRMADERALLLAMLDLAPIAMRDLDGTVRFWSDGCTQMYGWTAEQAIGRMFHDLLHLSFAMPREDIEAELLQRGQWSGEARARTRDGAELVVLIHKIVQRNVSGAITGVMETTTDLTHLRRSQDNLRASQAEFRSVVDAAAEGIVVASADGRIKSVNHALLRMFGYDHAEQVLGHDLSVLIAAGQANSVEDDPSARQAVRRDGTLFPIDVSVNFFGGDQRSTVAVVRDASDRIDAGRALRRSEARLRQFIDDAPVAIAMFDTAMRYLAASRRYIADYHLDGHPQTPLIGRGHYELFPEIPEAWRDVHRRVLAGETLSSEAEPFTRASGQTYWVRWEMVPWRQTDGTIGGAMLFSEDVTDGKQAEAALLASEARRRLIVEAAPNALVMVNARGVIEMVNARVEQLFGYERAELLGQNVDILVPDAQRARHPALCAAFLDAPRARPMGASSQLRARRKDGGTFEVEIGLSPIETEDGIKVLAAIVDISARVQLEAQLRQSQKMEAVGRLTAGVAHDFNNLLQALGGSLEMVRDELADRPTALEFADIALRATHRGSELTSRLLSFSRQQMLQPRAVPIRKLLADVQPLIGHLFDGSTEIVMAPAADGLAALADPSQLEAAIINLAVNARDAMPAGGRLSVSARDAEADPAMGLPAGAYTVISVADTGGGMDPATLAQACEPFFSTKGVKGSGLGLSMVQGFARQSGGDVRIVSAVGAGTTVQIWLPSASTTAADATPPVEDERPRLRGRVLVVDDSPDVLLTVGAFLQKAGLEVTRVATGDLAMTRLLTGDRFDVIVTDFAMPGLNGLDLLEQAREIDPALTGLIITGFTDPDLLRGQDHIGVLRKPFSRAELVSRVTQLIGVAQHA